MEEFFPRNSSRALEALDVKAIDEAARLYLENQFDKDDKWRECRLKAKNLIQKREWTNEQVRRLEKIKECDPASIDWSDVSDQSLGQYSLLSDSPEDWLIAPQPNKRGRCYTTDDIVRSVLTHDKSITAWSNVILSVKKWIELMKKQGSIGRITDPTKPATFLIPGIGLSEEQIKGVLSRWFKKRGWNENQQDFFLFLVKLPTLLYPERSPEPVTAKEWAEKIMMRPKKYSTYLVALFDKDPDEKRRAIARDLTKRFDREVHDPAAPYENKITTNPDQQNKAFSIAKELAEFITNNYLVPIYNGEQEPYQLSFKTKYQNLFPQSQAEIKLRNFVSQLSSKEFAMLQKLIGEISEGQAQVAASAT